MITAVDNQRPAGHLSRQATHHSQSREWLRAAYDTGAVIVCDLAYAELVPAFGDRAALDGALREVNTSISPINSSIAYEAGLRWMRYRRAGGPRKRIISDFLIGAHALAAAEDFLTRDRGFFSTYSPI